MNIEISYFEKFDTNTIQPEESSLQFIQQLVFNSFDEETNSPKFLNNMRCNLDEYKKIQYMKIDYFFKQSKMNKIQEE